MSLSAVKGTVSRWVGSWLKFPSDLTAGPAPAGLCGSSLCKRTLGPISAQPCRSWFCPRFPLQVGQGLIAKMAGVFWA